MVEKDMKWKVKGKRVERESRIKDRKMGEKRVKGEMEE